MKPTDEDWEVLGIEPDSEIGQVRRAYRERRAIYDENALATYNMLEEDERTKIVERIDAAYERIVGTAPATGAGELHAAAAAPEADVPAGPPPDPETDPGAHLRHQRLELAVSLHHVESEIKVGVPILERIENEEFDALPAPVFVRGHVEQFAREVGIDDPSAFARLYIAKMQGGSDGD
jgi:hypothetical protein